MPLFALALACFACLGVHARPLEVPKASKTLSRLLLTASPRSGWQAAGAEGRCGHRVSHLGSNCVRVRPVVLKKSSAERRKAAMAALEKKGIDTDDIKTPTKTETSEPEELEFDPDTFDKDAAFAKMQEMFEKVGEIMKADEIKDLSYEERKEKVKGIVDVWYSVSVPVASFTLVEIGVFIPFFGILLALLNYGPLSFAEIVDAAKDVQFLGDALKSINPSLGNVAIALLVCEIIYPIQFAFAVSQTPKAIKALTAWLKEKNLTRETIFNNLVGMAETAAANTPKN